LEGTILTPVEVIVWACVVVFVVIAFLTLLHVSGLYKFPNTEHGNVLFKALIVEIVVVAIAAFAIAIKTPIEPNGSGEESVATFGQWWRR
jgi:hypothetical protein